MKKSKNTIEITERPELKTSEIMNLMRDKFKVWSYYDDNRLDSDFPAPREATVRHFMKEQEPDRETLGMSVNDFEMANPKESGITLRERLLFEIAYFDETGEHLDIKGVTFCSGSRNSDGVVPCVYFFEDKVSVRWYGLDYAYAKYGVRSAVSLPSSLELHGDSLPRGSSVISNRR